MVRELHARLRWGILPIVLLGALGFGCRGFDPNEFDARLRQATFDAYVETIDRQFGGLHAAGVTAEELSDRYRERAVVAETLESFYGELRAMLADLDDPHAALQVSPRFWSGPVAEPEWVQFIRFDEAVWIGMPEASVRSPEEMTLQISEWLKPLGADRADELDPRGIAAFLRLSAAYGQSPFSGRRAHSSDQRDPRLKPLRWMELRAVDGRAVETPHDAELLIRGVLGSVARIDVAYEEPGKPPVRTSLALLRNAGVFETEKAAGGIRRRLSPWELAHKVDPDAPRTLGNIDSRSPVAAGRALRRARRRSAFLRGRRIPIRDPAAEAFGLEAWWLHTPGGTQAAYLRIGSFRSSLNEGDDSENLTLYGPLKKVMEAFRGADHWIVDVSQNPGGSWQEAGLFVSYFLDAADEIVPHEVTSVKMGGNLLFRTQTTEVHRLARMDVPRVAPATIHVLVDQDTASAGEIVASTLRGTAGATLVGERTAGAEYSTAEFEAPDGSVLRIGLSGGMMAPYESFQGRGLTPNITLKPQFSLGAPKDLEAWRTIFRYEALRAALGDIDDRLSVDL